MADIIIIAQNQNCHFKIGRVITKCSNTYTWSKINIYAATCNKNVSKFVMASVDCSAPIILQSQV